MPILHDILDHEVIGREFKKGLSEGPREGERQILISRFNPLPARIQKKLLDLSTEQVSELISLIWDAEELQDLSR